jgi:hypothetical protein
MTTPDNVLETLEQTCQTHCLAAFARLKDILPASGTEYIGVLLCGSGADPQRFLPHSDLDVHVLSFDTDTGRIYAETLARHWALYTGNRPALNIALAHATRQDDPYWRVSVWLCAPAHPWRAQAHTALETAVCRRAHLLESWCETRSMRRMSNRHKPVNLRTHPDALRAIWQMKYLSRACLALHPQQNADWVPRLLAAYDLPDPIIQAATECAQHLWMARSFVSAPSEPHSRDALPHCALETWQQRAAAAHAAVTTLLERGMSPLKTALDALHQAMAHLLEIDLDAMAALLAADQVAQLTACRRGGDAAVVLAWCASAAAVLETIAHDHLDNPLICMGLAFNRATPATIVCQMIDTPAWSLQRPLLRRRCYKHPAHKQESSAVQRAFLRRALEQEPVSMLRKTLEHAIQRLDL